MDAFIDGQQRMSPPKAQELLQELAGREGQFKANVERSEYRRYYVGRYKELKKLLKTAIAKNESIICSV